MLSLHRALLRLRRSEPALSIGSIAEVQAHDYVLAYRRQNGASRLQILLNLSATERHIPGGLSDGELLLSTLGDRAEGWLRPDEGLILRLAGA